MTDDSERRSRMTSNLNRLQAFRREKMDAAAVNKATMSVREMREMLGLKKTDSYWLVHRELFETILVNGRMRVVTESFEAWYANQIKYHKVDGPPPGKELKERSFSPQDIAEMLDIPEHIAYDIIRRDNIPTIEVDCWMRVDRKVFFDWYATQDRYRTKDDREVDQELEDASMTMPQMAWFLGIPRSTVYKLLSQKNELETVTIAGRRRVMIDSFWRWYAAQNTYEIKYKTLKLSNEAHAEAMHEINCSNFKKLAEEKGHKWGDPEAQASHRRISDRGLAYSRNVTIEKNKEFKDEVINGVLIPADGRMDNVNMEQGSEKYYSVEEVMDLLGLQRRTVLEKIRRGEIPAVKVIRYYRIPKEAIDQLIKNRKGE